jgi:D-3-phosphoglycerate dehydrogenase
MHIVVAEPYEGSAVSRLEQLGRVTVLDTCDEQALVDAVRDAHALLIRSRACVTRVVLEAGPHLRVVGRGGVGIENVDVQSAYELGIAVVFTPGAATEAVADLTVGLMLDLVRRIHPADAAVRSGHFLDFREASVDRELSELTLGVIGLGRIGKAVARRCRAGFRMNVLYNDIVEPGFIDFVALPVDKAELYRRADVVSLHVPLTDQTRQLIDDAALAGFKHGAILINTARGAVVDGEAVARALNSGHLGGAALDVFDPEPPPPTHPLMTAPNTLFTPHLGARTHRGLARMNDVVDDVVAVLRGEQPRFCAPRPQPGGP